MAFTTVNNIYRVHFRIARKVGNVWKEDPVQGEHSVVATDSPTAVGIVQGYMGHDGVTVNVMCHGGVRQIESNVIIAV